MGKVINTILFVALATSLFSGCKLVQEMPIYQYKDHQLINVQVGNLSELSVEVVSAPASIIQGLSGRDELGADGMLFIFDQPRIPSFWMKDMKFDLDLVWIRENKVVEVTKNVPAPSFGTQLYELPSFSPSQSVDMVLEVEAGNAHDWAINPGSELFFEGI